MPNNMRILYQITQFTNHFENNVLTNKEEEKRKRQRESETSTMYSETIRYTFEFTDAENHLCL